MTEAARHVYTARILLQVRGVVAGIPADLQQTAVSWRSPGAMSGKLVDPFCSPSA